MAAREIERAAVALGFPRRVSYAQIGREFAVYVPQRNGTGKPFDGEHHARFQAVAKLYLLMGAVREVDRVISKEQKYISELTRLTRKYAAQASREAQRGRIAA
jgi:hypothetical protein